MLVDHQKGEVLLNLREAAQELRISIRTLQRLVLAGAIAPSYISPQRPFFPRGEIERYKRTGCLPAQRRNGKLKQMDRKQGKQKTKPKRTKRRALTRPDASQP